MPHLTGFELLKECLFGKLFWLWQKHSLSRAEKKRIKFHVFEETVALSLFSFRGMGWERKVDGMRRRSQAKLPNVFSQKKPFWDGAKK